MNDKFSFDNEELKEIKPSKIILKNTNNDIDDFFLVLGLFFNDLKGLNFYLMKLEEWKNEFKVDMPDNKATSYIGEYSGMALQLQRLIIGSIYELTEFLEKNKHTIFSPMFLLYLKKISPENKKRWTSLVDISSSKRKKNKKDSFYNSLLMIRNMSFHYDKKVLRKGFRDFFYESEKKLWELKSFLF